MMIKKKSMNIGTKITLQLLAVLAVILLAAFSYIVYTSNLKNSQAEKDSVKSLSTENAIMAKDILDKPMQTAMVLAHALQGFESVDAKSRRAYYNGIMQTMIQNDKSILGLWTVWEPNALDGMDASFAGQTGTDATGRFVPYWVWDNGTVSNVACADYDTAGAGDYYLLAKNSGKDTVLEPYTYQISGKDVLMTTFAVPIKDANGKVLGVAGVDMTLANLQSTQFDKWESSNSYTLLVSNSGNIMIHPDLSYVGKNLKDILTAGSLAGAAQAVKDGKSVTLTDKSIVDGQPAQLTFMPITIGDSESPWSAAIVVHTEDINAATTQTTTMLIILFALLLASIAAALTLFIRQSISKPVQATAGFAKKIASGDLEASIAIKSMDEIGQLQTTLDSDVRKAFREIREADEISLKQSQYQADEVKKLIANLNKIARGDMNCTIEIAPADKDTHDLHQLFSDIGAKLQNSIDAVKLLTGDANMLVQAAIDGKLSTRVDATRHLGEFRKIIEGVNSTLDAVIQPVNEAASVLKEMSQGNLSVSVTGQYKGEHAAIKDALNDTISTIKSYVGEISNTLTEMAAGDLNLEIDREYRGDFTEIKNAINHIAASLSGVMGDIQTSAEQVAAGTQQVSSGSQALSQGATEQASAIEQLTASVGEIAGQTRENAINAGQANELATIARDNAVTGNRQMSELQRAMIEINESSASISRIIKVIDDIAFQTNLLALNAAVEAARAGQHGKGFAVVAEEVRNLAQRSAVAAKETTEMIESSIKKANEGTKIANNTAEALVKIVDDVEKATELIGGIARASGDQATAVAQVNTGIEQVSMVTQTNSATAEQSAAASEELSSQAALLKEMTGRFNLKSQAEHFSREAAPRQPAKARALQAGKPKITLGDKDFGKY